MVSLDDYKRQVECAYGGEQYSARDNGAVMRHLRLGQRKRKLDGQWTFGRLNSQNGYLHISGKRVHRIVATGFYGEPPEPEYVVDHIDTNRQNNRPENIRWITRLENALNNPVTRKKIEYLCGSIEAFLEKPSMLNELQGEPNIKWMRAVTPEEAENCRVRMSTWVRIKSKAKSTSHAVQSRQSFDERAYKPLQKWEVGLAGELGLELALTPGCAQYMWRADAYFPCCPQVAGQNAVDDYFHNLTPGAVLALSEHEDFCPMLTVFKAKVIQKRSSIVVMCERADSKWSIVWIMLDEKSQHFIHFVLGIYVSKEDAEMEFSTKDENTDFWSEGYASFGVR